MSDKPHCCSIDGRPIDCSGISTSIPKGLAFVADSKRHCGWIVYRHDVNSNHPLLISVARILRRHEATTGENNETSQKNKRPLNRPTALYLLYSIYSTLQCTRVMQPINKRL